MSYHDILRKKVARWARLIQDPIGFPDDPPIDACWLWTGACSTAATVIAHKVGAENKPLRTYTRQIKGGAPRARMFGDEVRPNRVLVALHLGINIEEVGRMRNTCGHGNCVNPLHQTKMGEAPTPRRREPVLPEPAPEPEPALDERDRAFQLFWNNSITSKQPPESVKLNPDWVRAYLIEYQQFISDKTKQEVERILFP